MEQTTKRVTVPLLLVVLMLLGINPLYGANTPDIKFIEKIEFSPGTELPLVPRDFCVTEDGLFIIPDQQTGNVKIYEIEGKFLKLIKIVGRKGFGRDALVAPVSCFYSKEESKLGIYAQGAKTIFIYVRIGRVEFKRVKEVFCPRGGTDFDLIGSRLLVAGYNSDRNKRHYHLYSVDLETDKVINLLPSYVKYGFGSHREFEVEYIKRDNIGTIGINGWFDIDQQANNVYFVWEGALRIIKININSQEMNSFGEKTEEGKSYYIKPYVSKRLLDAYDKGDPKTIRKEWAKMSYIRDIFTNSKYVLVIYEGPVKPGGESNFWLQLYTLEGTFKRELSIPGQPSHMMFFDKYRNLYSLSNKSEKGEYFILKYEIIEKGVK